ncbi:MAG: outer membrane beta-barrel domain-containing protein [Myxococcota bacterium]|nr:outer membrane beta-barrel domain-containing protein [Myxococcota bacterium]
MRTASIFLAVLVSAAPALASEAPEYSADPFGDFALTDDSLILNVEFPTAETSELGLLFTTSMIDKYSTHVGGQLDYTYYLSQTLGVSLSAGFTSGSLTSIVTGARGIIGSKVAECMKDQTQCPGGDVTPYVPDYKQVTWSTTANAVWAPLYGKLNLVSELNLNLQFYAIAGLGVNGVTEVQAIAREEVRGIGESFAEDDLERLKYDETNGETGAVPHVSIGAGLKVFLLDWVALRAEVRGLMFVDQFDFDLSDDALTEESYLSRYYFANLGLSFTVF